MAKKRGSVGQVLAAAVVAGVVFVFGVLMLQSRAVESTVQFDPETNCQLNRQLQGHLVVLIDVTDGLAPELAEEITADLRGPLARMRGGEKLTIALVDDTSNSVVSAAVTACSPPRGLEASVLTSNSTMIERKWQKEFADPVLARVAALATDREVSRSGIVQSIQRISELPDFGNESGVPRQELVIYSDWLENQIFQSAQETLPRNLVSQLSARLETLAGVAVKPTTLVRTKRQPEQDRAERVFMEAFASSGTSMETPRRICCLVPRSDGTTAGAVGVGASRYP